LGDAGPGVFVDGHVAFVEDCLLGVGVAEPVVSCPARFFGDTSDFDRGVVISKGVVAEFQPSSRRICAILPVFSTVHIEAVTESRALLDVVSGDVAAARAACAGDVVAVVVEHVALDQAVGDVVADAVSKALILVVVDEVVADVVTRSPDQVGRGVATAYQLAVVDSQTR